MVSLLENPILAVLSESSELVPNRVVLRRTLEPVSSPCGLLYKQEAVILPLKAGGAGL